MRTLLLSLALASALVSPPAFASDDAERYRLEQELEKLAQRNAWAGVERMYGDLLALGVPLTPNDHLIGSQAAGSRGETLIAMERLEAAVRAGDEAASAADTAWVQAKSSLDALQQRYGKVDIVVVAPRLAALVRYAPPFAADERQAIDVARQTLVASSGYRGLLPIGKYMVDGLVFEVHPGAELLEIKVTP